MKKQDDILKDALNALKNDPVPPGPPQELIDATAKNLNKTRGQSQPSVYEPIKIADWLRLPIKAAAAAALLIVAGAAGYVGGRFSPPPQNIQQLQAALEPAIHKNLLEDMSHYWQVGLANSYIRLKDELSEQYRRDLNQSALRTLAASGTATNELLKDLIQAINTANLEDRRWVTAALHQIESDRLKDKTQLANGLEALAVQTDDELKRTRQDMVKLLSYTPGNLIPENCYQNDYCAGRFSLGNGRSRTGPRNDRRTLPVGNAGLPAGRRLPSSGIRARL